MGWYKRLCYAVVYGKGCASITSGDTEPVVQFDVVNSPAELAAECPGSPEKAVNSL